MRLMGLKIKQLEYKLKNSMQMLSDSNKKEIVSPTSKSTLLF